MTNQHRKNILEILGRRPVHPFPARMAPGIALEALGDGGPLRVLDPMVGSGTVLAVARAKGHRAIGVDLDPLAVLLATVWTTTIDNRTITKTAASVLSRAWTCYRSLSARRAYPANSDDETKLFIRYWFDDVARRQLTALATEIAHIGNESIRNALWCGFSRLIIAKTAGASLAMDLAHSRPHRTFKRAPVKPFDRFLAAVEAVAANCPQRGASLVGPRVTVMQGDARKLNIDNASVDLVLTSPPYLNAIDYMRCSKFSLVWMGHTVDKLRTLRSVSVGAEVGDHEALQNDAIAQIISGLNLRPVLPSRQRAILARYVDDMRRTISEAFRVLVPGGKAVFVVGENTVKGTYIRNSGSITALATLAGLSLQDRKTRLLPANRRYLPPPTKMYSGATLGARMHREVILTFKKPIASHNAYTAAG